jgi:hypothetical protein
MLELSPPLPSLLLPRVGGLSRLNTRAVHPCLCYDTKNGKEKGKKGRLEGNTERIIRDVDERKKMK